MEYGIGISNREKVVNISDCITYKVDPAALEELYPTNKTIKIPLVLAPGNWKNNFNRKDAIRKAVQRAVDIYFDGGDWKDYLGKYKG